MSKSIVLLDTATGAKAQDVEYLASDIEPENVTTIKVQVSGTAVDVQITFDSGSTWVDLFGTLTANTYTEQKIAVIPGDQINFRTNNGAGITLDFFRVVELDTVL